MVAVQFAICLVPLCGVVAFVIDCGMLLDNRRRVQAAADAAALAAAADLYQHYVSNGGADTGGTASASATATAAANGFSSPSATVTVHIPPASGSFSGKAGYAEVVVQYNQERGFSGIFGSGTIPVTARAVSRGLWTSFGDGILVLNPTGAGTLRDSGNGTITVNGAAIVVDSNSASAAEVSGNGTVSAPDFVITGSPGEVTSGNGRFIGGVDSGATPTVDPLLYLTPPNPNTLTVQSSSKYTLSSNQSRTLNPGVYNGGISISGNASATLNAGIYYMAGGGFSATANTVVDGTSGVLIYNAPISTSDTISIAGNGGFRLSPPTSGPYQGISIFQDRASTAPLNITGNGGMSLTGTIYAAHATLNVSGNGSNNVIGSQFISYNLAVSGNGTVTVNWSATGTSRTRSMGLVE